MPCEKASSRPSSFNGGVAYIQNKQLLFFFPSSLYKNNNEIKIIGEVGYYIYFYNYYGVGSDSRAKDKEIYDVQYPRIHTSFLHRFGEFYKGVKTKFHNFKITETPEGGLLQNDQWAKQGGGQLLTFGPLLQYDTKDFQFHPSQGCLIKAGIVTSRKGKFSDASFTKFHLDARHCFSLKTDHIIALNLDAGHISGTVPLSELFHFGSNKRARGYADCRFKDRTFLAYKNEYRFPIWNWIGGVVFGSASALANGLSNIIHTQYRYSGGVGLRFTLNEKDRVRLRLDCAISEEGTNCYLIDNNAF